MNCNAAYCESSLAKRASPAPAHGQGFSHIIAGSRRLLTHAPKAKQGNAVPSGGKQRLPRRQLMPVTRRADQPRSGIEIPQCSGTVRVR
jgi:hypothetical protein